MDITNDGPGARWKPIKWVLFVGISTLLIPGVSTCTLPNNNCNLSKDTRATNELSSDSRANGDQAEISGIYVYSDTLRLEGMRERLELHVGGRFELNIAFGLNEYGTVSGSYVVAQQLIQLSPRSLDPSYLKISETYKAIRHNGEIYLVPMIILAEFNRRLEENADIACLPILKKIGQAIGER